MGHRVRSPEEAGRLSNPVQRRLSSPEIDHLAQAYADGISTDALARLYDVHRTTVMAHLELRGVPRRVNRRKLSDHDVSEATLQYCSGDSLAVVARAFNVDAATVRRELARVGVTIRPRPGSA